MKTACCLNERSRWLLRQGFTDAEIVLTGPVDVYGLFIGGELIVNGKVVPRNG